MSWDVLVSGEECIPSLPEAIKLFEIGNREEIQETLRKQEALVNEMKEMRSEDKKVKEEQKKMIDELTERVKEEEDRHRKDLAEIELKHADLINSLESEHNQTTEEKQNQMELKHKVEMKRGEQKLIDAKSFINYLGKILFNSNEKNKEQQQLIELQAASIAVKTETLAAFRNNYRSILTHECMNDSSTISQQAQVIQLQGRWINAVIPLLKYTEIPSHLRLSVDRSGAECRLKG